MGKKFFQFWINYSTLYTTQAITPPDAKKELTVSIYNTPPDAKKELIVPIYKKKGDLDDPNYYRGRALISCLANLFNNILNERLTNFLRKNKIISEYQTGFSKKPEQLIICLSYVIQLTHM